MSKKRVYVLLLFALLLIANGSAIFTEAFLATAQGVIPIEIDRLNQSTAGGTSLITVSGSGFSIATTRQGTKVIYGGEILEPNKIVSTSELNFLVPEDTYCGFHDISLRKLVGPGIPVQSDSIPLLINNSCKTWQVQQLAPDRGEPGTQVIIKGGRFPIDAQVQFGGRTIPREDLGGTANWIDFAEMSFTVPDEAECGDNRVEIGAPSLVGTFSEAVNFVVTGSPCASPPPVDPSPPPPPAPPPGPPPSDNDSGRTVEDYDNDGNCVIDDPEFFSMIDDWINQDLDNQSFFQGVDAWISQANICSSAATNVSLRIERTAEGVQFTLAGRESLGLFTILDSNGQVIYQDHSTGPQHFWNMRSTSGQLIANGVYFLISQKTGQVQRFLVMR